MIQRTRASGWSLVLVLGLCASASALLAPAALAEDAPGSAPIALEFPEPTPVLDIYRSLDRVSDFDLVLDPDLDNRPITFELPETPPREALALLARTVGHFIQPLGDDLFLVAADTPAHRRHYEPLALRIIVLEHLKVREAMTVLRALLEAKKLATLDEHNALIVRDTEEKVELIAELLRRLDKPPGELKKADLEPMILGPEDRLGHPEPTRLAEKP